MKHLLVCSSLVVTFLQCTTTFGQPAAAPAAPSPPAPPVAPVAPAAPVVVTPFAPAGGPAPSGPLNIMKILNKASQYTVLLKLLKTTSVGDQINAQLNDTSNSMTIFAPDDNAFGSLKTGTLNSLSAEEQVELVQFHVVPTFLSKPQFQTVSNPLRTQAGGSGKYDFPMNLATNGSTVNLSTGLTNATVTNTIYSDNQLAVYEVDKVLLPMRIFGPKPPAPAPSPVKKAKKKKPTVALSPEADNVPADTSGAAEVMIHRAVIVGLGFIGTFFL